jgi:hypothetical protein
MWSESALIYLSDKNMDSMATATDQIRSARAIAARTSEMGAQP